MPPKKVIIDTDPGVDDTLALLLAHSLSVQSPPSLEVLLISICFGNTPSQQCLHNVLTLYSLLSTAPPPLALGASGPLSGNAHTHDGFHGADGLQGAHTAMPELSAPRPDPTQYPDATGAILQVLEREEPGTVTVIVLGPATNLALAARRSPDVVSRTKEVVLMAGALAVPGNVTPVAEFNVHSDPEAAAETLALSSRGVAVTLVTLDVTTLHSMFLADLPPESNDPKLLVWLRAIIHGTFTTLRRYWEDEDEGMSLHDPLAVYYVADADSGQWEVKRGLDVRVETKGEWTTGMLVWDRRGKKAIAEEAALEGMEAGEGAGKADVDRGGWLSGGGRNSIGVVMRTPQSAEGGKRFAEVLVEAIWGLAKGGHPAAL